MSKFAKEFNDRSEQRKAQREQRRGSISLSSQDILSTKVEVLLLLKLLEDLIPKDVKKIFKKRDREELIDVELIKDDFKYIGTNKAENLLVDKNIRDSIEYKQTAQIGYDYVGKAFEIVEKYEKGGKLNEVFEDKEFQDIVKKLYPNEFEEKMNEWKDKLNEKQGNKSENTVVNINTVNSSVVRQVNHQNSGSSSGGVVKQR
ncbi:hypothetical protein KDE13_09155 [Campylobacter sp. faydin G-140]|uniref:hypothetical protein n=1 Tax=Campylobacter anatolicus TaxID=2829105 RepID=UPI001B9F253C|nr:hypothetical protein [Campylobacter anatolicus]MBR8466500.1 hypothetical protein [Campylobacter anatolicus]